MGIGQGNVYGAVKKGKVEGELAMDVNPELTMVDSGKGGWGLGNCCESEEEETAPEKKFGPRNDGSDAICQDPEGSDQEMII